MSIHPSSRLGKLEAQLETARAAHQASSDELATLATEAGDLDRWIEAADLDTPDLEYAKRNARRAKYANVMARVRTAQATQRQTLAELEKQSRPMHETFERVASTLAQMVDPASELARLTPPYLLEREKKELTLWMEEWTDPEAPAVDDLEPVEA